MSEQALQMQKSVAASREMKIGGKGSKLDVKRLFLLLLGPVLFAVFYLLPPLPAAVDPKGQAFELSPQGQAAIALFLFTMTWWVAEVVPIGVTAIAIGVIQAAFLIRDPRVVFTDYMDPSVWFIFASLVIGMAFTRTGLTRRIAYRMLVLVGEKTSMIYLGCFVLTVGLTLIMAHTAVAATVYPLLMAVYSMYSDDMKPSRFGKGLFMGMAYVAGAGSIITLLGAARGAVAIGFLKEMTGRSVGFFEFSYYLLPVGAAMAGLIWLLVMIVYRPEKKSIEGLRERARRLYRELGPITSRETLALVIVLAVVSLLGVRSFVPWLKGIDKSAIILCSTVLFFVFKILKLEDLEETSWNIVLLFGGAMSIGYCLWQTGAAKWLAIHWLSLFQHAHWLLFVMGIAFFVLVMTNFIMNVAAIAISLPVALVIAPYLGVSPEVIFFASLVTAGMPFMLLIGAAPNAIAYASGQFTSKEFFTTGLLASLILLVLLAVFVLAIWPLMGMPVQIGS